MRFEGSFLNVQSDDRLEYGICCGGCDPEQGDDARGMLHGVAFATIARTRMNDVPICNARLQVEAIGFPRRPVGHWAKVSRRRAFLGLRR